MQLGRYWLRLMALASSCWIGQSFLGELLLCCLLMGTHLGAAAQREAICQPQVCCPSSSLSWQWLQGCLAQQ